MILALDPGGNLGWALVDGGTGTPVVIHAIGVIAPPVYPEGVDLPQVITKPAAAWSYAAGLSCLAGEHRCWRADESWGACVAEDLELALPDRKVDRVIAEELGLHSGTVPAIVDNCMPWGALTAIACLLGAELWCVSPKKWQRVVCPVAKGEQLEYTKVRKAAVELVERLGTDAARRAVGDLGRKAGHALDAAGIGTCFAVGEPARRIA